MVTILFLLAVITGWIREARYMYKMGKSNFPGYFLYTRPRQRTRV